METATAWVRRKSEDPSFRQLYEEERLILEAAEEIAAAMAEHGLTRANLAERIGSSRANVTRLLSGSRNMTLRSLAKLAHACGHRAEVQLAELHDEVFVPVGNSVTQVAAAGRVPVPVFRSSDGDQHTMNLPPAVTAHVPRKAHTGAIALAA